MKADSRLDITSETNAGIIEYMDQLSQGQGIVHPDVEQRMKELSQRLVGTSLRKYKNSTIITNDQSSSIVAVAFGTAYSIKTGRMFKNAIDSGAKTSHQWSDRTSLNLTETFGPDWIVGAWEKDEEDWIQSNIA